mgnify:CR=1 FL=1
MHCTWSIVHPCVGNVLTEIVVTNGTQSASSDYGAMCLAGTEVYGGRQSSFLIIIIRDRYLLVQHTNWRTCFLAPHERYGTALLQCQSHSLLLVVHSSADTVGSTVSCVPAPEMTQLGPSFLKLGLKIIGASATRLSLSSSIEEFKSNFKITPSRCAHVYRLTK